MIALSSTTWVLLLCLGIGRNRVLESHSYSGARHTFSFSIAVQAKPLPVWAKTALFSTAILGLALLLLPGRKAHPGSEPEQ